MLEVQPQWRRSGGLALVCEKCSNVRYAEDFPERAGDEHLQLRDYLKTRLKAAGHWGTIRAVGTTCLDVCGKGTITVVLDPVASGEPQRCIVMDPMKDREALYDEIVRTLIKH